MSNNPIKNGDPSRLAALLSRATDDLPHWTSDDLADILAHQLRAPLMFARQRIQCLATAEARVALERIGQINSADIHSLGELFVHAAPPLSMLKSAAKFAQSAKSQEGCNLPAEVASVLYFSAFAAGLVRLGERITALDNCAVEKGLKWALAQAWIDDQTRALFESVASRLDLDAARTTQTHVESDSPNIVTWATINDIIFASDGSDRCNEGPKGPRNYNSGDVVQIPDDSTHPTPDLERPLVDGYQVTDKIGEGGMGSVWRAVQRSTRRVVALKLINSGPWASKRARHQFNREVELTARLEHPHIARVYDSGLQQGICFYAMELIDGLPLDEFVRESKLDRRSILKLMSVICAAVQHAHLHGVIHRDLKPSNILVDIRGHPHLLDFGLAKALLLDDLAVSVDGEVAGTPAYMSPEQASGKTGCVDVRTDVYSLGVILYRLLADHPPHDLSGSPLEVLCRIAEHDAAPPGLGKQRGGRELEAILLKALARNPDRRYASAGELGRDIDCVLNAEPVSARPPTLSYILFTWLRRHWLPAAAATAVIATILTSFVYSYARISHERNAAVYERTRADEQTRLATASAARAAAEQVKAENQRIVAEENVARSLKAQGDAMAEAGRWVEAKLLYQRSRQIFIRLGESPRMADLGLVQAYSVSPPPLNQFVGHSDYISCAAFSPDGRVAVTGSFDHTLKLWYVRTGRELRTLAGHTREIRCVAFSPTGTRVLSGGKDDTARIWDVATGRQVALLPHTYEVFAVAFSSDGTLCASSAWDGWVKIWETETGRLVTQYSNGNKSPINSICFESNPVGRGPQRVFFGDNSGLSELNLSSGAATPMATSSREAKLCLAASPDGAQVLVGVSREHPKNEETAILIPTTSKGSIQPLVGHGAAVRTVAFLPDGIHALSASDDGLIKRWDVRTGKVERTFSADEKPFQCVAFSTDGQLAISGGDGNVAKLWDLRGDALPMTIKCPPIQISALAVSRDGNTILSGSVLDGVHLWDVASGHELARPTSERGSKPEQGVKATALSPDGAKGYVAFASGRVVVFDLTTWTDGPEQTLCVHPSLRSMALSPDGLRAVIADGGNVALWDLVRRERIFTVKTPSTLIGGTGFCNGCRSIVGCSSHGEALFFDATTGQNNLSLDLLPRNRELINDAPVAYTADLTTMLGIAGPVIKMWTPMTGRTIADLTGHSGDVIALAVCPNQPWAASCSADSTVRIWDLSHAEEIQCFRGHQEAVSSVAFTTDGAKLFSAGSDPWIRIWDFGRPQAFFDFATRINQARTALNRNPQDSVALAALGEWYAFRGLDDWAAELLEQARSNGAKVSSLALARVYWSLNRIEKAKVAFEEAIRSREAPEIYLRQCIGALTR